MQVQQKQPSLHSIQNLLAVDSQRRDRHLQGFSLGNVIGLVEFRHIGQDQVIAIHADIQTAIIISFFDVQAPEDGPQAPPLYAAGTARGSGAGVAVEGAIVGRLALAMSASA